MCNYKSDAKIALITQIPPHKLLFWRLMATSSRRDSKKITTFARP